MVDTVAVYQDGSPIQEYPKKIKLKDGTKMIVHSREEEEAIGSEIQHIPQSELKPIEPAPIQEYPKIFKTKDGVKLKFKSAREEAEYLKSVAEPTLETDAPVEEKKSKSKKANDKSAWK